MSTKIHNGYYIENLSLEKLHELCMALRREMKQEWERLYINNITVTALRLMDVSALLNAGIYQKEDLNTETKSIDGRTPLEAAMKIFRDSAEAIQKTQQRNPEYDLSCEIVFMPVKAGKLKKILVAIYTEREEFIKIWERVPIVHPYFFWDNTDKPDEIEESDWEQRMILWRGINIPSLQGFSIQCTPPYPYLPTTSQDSIKKSLFDPHCDVDLTSRAYLEKRVMVHTKSILLRRFAKERDEQINITNYKRLLEEMITWTKDDPEGTIKFHSLSNEIRSILTKKDIIEGLYEKCNIEKVEKTNRAHYIEWNEEKDAG